MYGEPAHENVQPEILKRGAVEGMHIITFSFVVEVFNRIIYHSGIIPARCSESCRAHGAKGMVATFEQPS